MHLKELDRQRHRLGHAVQRQVALHFRRRAILELGEFALVGRGRESWRRRRNSARVQVLVEFAVAGVDRRRCRCLMSTVPVFASLSSTMVPEVDLNLPRHTDMPPK